MLVHWIWFSLLPELTGRKKLELLERFHSPEDIYHADRHALRDVEGLSSGAVQGILDKALDRAQNIWKACMEKNISILAFSDSAYPARLRSIEDAPMVLYYRGCMPALENLPVIGVVGTREATPYGLRTAESISAQIAACGGIVVSGGALGIDSAALKGALSVGARAVAVLAGGLDKVYPKANSPLFDRIMENGCLLSEYPPEAPCYKGNFLRRNRIISGISNGVLVVEAPRASGALNTAKWAVEQGRDLFAVPGNIDVASCSGSNALISDGARAVMDGWSILKEYEVLFPGMIRRVAVLPMQERPAKKTPAKSKVDKKTIDKGADTPYSVINNEFPSLNDQERAVVEALTKAPMPVDLVVAKAAMPTGTVLSILTKLALKGVVQSHPGKRFSKK